LAELKEHKKICTTVGVINVKRRFIKLRRMIEEGHVKTFQEQQRELDKIVDMLATLPDSVHEKLGEFGPIRTATV
jgi:hypothetical protein